MKGTTFVAMTDRKRAETEHKKTRSVEDTLIRWYAQKHKLPVNHELIQKCSTAFLYGEMLKDLHQQRDEVEEAIKASPKADKDLLKRLRDLEVFLGMREETEGVVTGDRVVDGWEAAIERGQVPSDLADWLSRPLAEPKGPPRRPR